MSLDRLSQIHNRKCFCIRATWTQVFISTETFASFDPPLPPSPPRPLCTLHLRILVCGSFSFTFALNIFHYGQESLWSKYWIGIRWLLSLRVNSQNTPYVGLCDCSQQTELRQRDTPRGRSPTLGANNVLFLVEISFSQTELFLVLNFPR